MHATAHTFELIRDEAWKQDYEDASFCHDTEQLIRRVLETWNRDHQYFSSVVAGSDTRENMRQNALILRLAEQAIAAVIGRAAISLSKGYLVDGVAEMIAALYEARRLLLRPLVRRMAERDPEGRSADAISQYLLRHVRFVDGRPVITDEIAAELPDPYE